MQVTARLVFLLAPANQELALLLRHLDLILTETGDGKTVLVVEHSNVTSNVPSVGNTVLDAKITYNTALAVPMAMQSESHETFRGSSFETKMNVTLSKDSFATP